MPKPAREHWERLNQNERDICRLIYQEKSDKAIVSELGVNPNTYKDRKKRIFQKLGVFNRVGVANRFREQT